MTLTFKSIIFVQTASFQDVLSEAEILALMVGCLCHDLDHRGTNNAFQAKWVTWIWIIINVFLISFLTIVLLFLQDRFCFGPALWDVSNPGASSLQPCCHDPAERGKAEIWSLTDSHVIWISSHDKNSCIQRDLMSATFWQNIQPYDTEKNMAALWSPKSSNIKADCTIASWAEKKTFLSLQTLCYIFPL